MTIREKRGRTKKAVDGNGQAKSEKQKKPKPKKTKLDKPKLINEKIEELMIARREHGSAMIEWEEAHARAGELKKTMERKQAMLNGIVTDIDNIRSGNYTPPLPFGETTDSPRTPTTMRADGPWKNVELSTLINGSILESLHEADLKTVGDLHNFTATNKRLSDIKGIGEGKAAKIEEAILKFWSDNPQFAETNGDGKASDEPAAASA